MKRDLEIAREIHRWLVPESPPSVDGIGIAFATSQPIPYPAITTMLHVAPDRREQPPALVVADDAGKSTPAALLMATIQPACDPCHLAPRPE
jgi:serine phosphatase RsbU (regulator of sigma subunit)